MLSIITTEASTIIPTPRMRPVIVIMFSVIPHMFIASRVMMMLSGIDTAMMMVVFIEQRKMKRMTTARTSPCHALSRRVLRVSRMLSVSSRTISIVMSDGSISLRASIFL